MGPSHLGRYHTAQAPALPGTDKTVTYHDHLGTTVAQAPDRPHSTPRVWFNRPEAAEYLGVHINTLDRYAKAGRIPSHRLGASVRFHRAELDAAILNKG